MMSSRCIHVQAWLKQVKSRHTSASAFMLALLLAMSEALTRLHQPITDQLQACTFHPKSLVFHKIVCSIITISSVTKKLLFKHKHQPIADQLQVCSFHQKPLVFDKSLFSENISFSPKKICFSNTSTSPQGHRNMIFIQERFYLQSPLSISSMCAASTWKQLCNTGQLS